MKTVARVLVIDDNAVVRTFFAEVLINLGYRVSTAADGEEGLQRFCAVRPDVVLLDLRLPGMEGEDVVTCLQLVDATVPIVIVSANADVDYARHLLSRGVFDYVSKPCDIHYLERVVATALAAGGRMAARESA